jgi:rubrerythrin
MNPNSAFRLKKLTAPGNSKKGSHSWECRECGSTMELMGTVIDGHKWLMNNSGCPNCGYDQGGPDGWDCID